MTETIESPAKPHNCATDGPPHSWTVVDPGKKPEDQKKEKKEKAAELTAKDEKRAAKAKAMKSAPAKPKNADAARSAAFEAKAIEENEKKKPIASCAVKYKCTNCGMDQEVDIVFEDGQHAECQSHSSENYRKAMLADGEKRNQAERYVDIQRQNNQTIGVGRIGVQPMTKFDGAHMGDTTKAEALAKGAGMEPEVVK